MNKKTADPLFGAAVLKLSMALKGMTDQPGFRIVYHGTLKELKLTDSQVDAYIMKNREVLEAQIKNGESGK